MAVLTEMDMSAWGTNLDLHWHLKTGCADVQVHSYFCLCSIMPCDAEYEVSTGATGDGKDLDLSSMIVDTIRGYKFAEICAMRAYGRGLQGGPRIKFYSKCELALDSDVQSWWRVLRVVELLLDTYSRELDFSIAADQSCCQPYLLYDSTIIGQDRNGWRNS